MKACKDKTNAGKKLHAVLANFGFPQIFWKINMWGPVSQRFSFFLSLGYLFREYIREKLIFKKNHFNLFIRGPDAFNSWKKCKNLLTLPLYVRNLFGIWQLTIHQSFNDKPLGKRKKPWENGSTVSSCARWYVQSHKFTYTLLYMAGQFWNACNLEKSIKNFNYRFEIAILLSYWRLNVSVSKLMGRLRFSLSDRKQFRETYGRHCNVLTHLWNIFYRIIMPPIGIVRVLIVKVHCTSIYWSVSSLVFCNSFCSQGLIRVRISS